MWRFGNYKSTERNWISLRRTDHDSHKFFGKSENKSQGTIYISAKSNARGLCNCNTNKQFTWACGKNWSIYIWAFSSLIKHSAVPWYKYVNDCKEFRRPYCYRGIHFIKPKLFSSTNNPPNLTDNKWIRYTTSCIVTTTRSGKPWTSSASWHALEWGGG